MWSFFSLGYKYTAWIFSSHPDKYCPSRYNTRKCHRRRRYTGTPNTVHHRPDCSSRRTAYLGYISSQAHDRSQPFGLPSRWKGYFRSLHWLVDRRSDHVKRSSGMVMSRVDEVKFLVEYSSAKGKWKGGDRRRRQERGCLRRTDITQSWMWPPNPFWEKANYDSGVRLVAIIYAGGIMILSSRSTGPEGRKYSILRATW